MDQLLIKVDKVEDHFKSKNRDTANSLGELFDYIYEIRKSREEDKKNNDTNRILILQE